MSKPRKKKRSPKRVLALPDLEQSKAAVLNSQFSPKAPRKEFFNSHSPLQSRSLRRSVVKSVSTVTELTRRLQQK